MNQEEILRFIELEAKKLDQKYSTPTGQQTTLLSGIKLKCPGGHDGHTYCLSCSNCSVACVNQDCPQCYKKHLKCQRMKKIKQFHSQIQQKIQPSFILGQIQQYVSLIDKKIHNMLQDIKSQIKTFRLTQIDKQMIKKIKAYHLNKQSIYSNDIIKYQQSQQTQKSKWFQKQTNKLDQLINNTKQFVNYKLDQIHKTLYYQYFQNSAHFQQKIFKQSNIFDNKVWKNQMLLMLKDLQPIKQINRIYCASTDAFLDQTFHSQCDNKPNLLYVVRNQFDKTYGGYSPCMISQDRSQKFQVDESQTSFIFSLDLHTKSNIVNKKFSIRNGYKSKNSKSNILIAFGNQTSPNFIVSQNSFSLSRQNWIDMYGGAYQQNNYSLMQLIGVNYLLGCKVKQFQVFQIVFNQNYQEKSFIINNLNIYKQQINESKKDNDMVQEQKQKIDIKTLINQTIDNKLETEKQQQKQSKKPSKTKKIQKPVQKVENQPLTNPKRRGRNAKAQEQKPIDKKVQKQRPVRKPRKAKNKKVEQQQSQYVIEDDNEVEQENNLEQCGQNQQQQNKQGIRHSFLSQLFGIPHEPFNRLGFLFRGNNEQQSSDSHHGRQRHHKRHKHGHHGRKHHWKRHHGW